MSYNREIVNWSAGVSVSACYLSMLHDIQVENSKYIYGAACNSPNLTMEENILLKNNTQG